MYQNVALVSIPSTLRQLGDPTLVGAPTSLRGPQPAINYAMSVRLNTAMDSPVGKTVSLDGAGYSGQPKLSKNGEGVYVVSYIGIDSVYKHDMTTDPELNGWIDTSYTMGLFINKDKYYKISLDTTSYEYLYKSLGFGDVFIEGNDFVVRYVFELPDANAAPKGTFGVGTRGGLTVPPWTTISGVEFAPTVLAGVVTYEVYTVTGGVRRDHGLTLYPGKIYTLDLVHVSSTLDLYARIWGPDGYVGTVTDNNLWGAVTASSLCVWNAGSISGTLDTFIKLYGAEAWFNTIVVKKSIDGCKSWSKIAPNPAAVGDEITECSVAVDNGGLVHLVWVEYGGTPSGYFNVFYATHDTLTWSTKEQVSELSSNYDRLNPNIVVDRGGIKVHICWRKNILSTGNIDIFYAYKDITYMEEFELGILES